jgi:hypothetical protein
VSAGAGRAHAARRAGRLLALACCCAAAPCSCAQALQAAIHPSFSPDRLGARTAFSFAFTLQGAEAAPPPPLSAVVVHLPAGMRLDVRGLARCPPSRLRAGGPASCPRGSVIGRGRSVLEVHAGSQTIPEEAVVQALLAPGPPGRVRIQIFGRGETPLQQRTISTAVLSADGAPYGSRLSVSIPPIPTVALEPDASILSWSLTIGRPGAGRGPAAAITVPRRCPAGGFPFATDFAFADHTSARALAHIPCP